MEKERLNYLDIMKGIGILLVIFSHAKIRWEYVIIIFAFHMPLFFCISGFLFQKKDMGYKQFVKKKAKSLLIPYASFSILTLLLSLLIEKNYDIKYLVSNLMFLNGSVFAINAPLWYLIVLFIVEISYFFIAKKSNRFKLCFVICLSVISYFNTMILPFGIHVALVSIVFFTLGDIFKTVRYRFNKINMKTYVYIVATFVLTILLGLKNNYVNIYRHQLGNYFIYFIVAISGTFCLYLISNIINKNKFLEYYGKNSLVILCTHYYIVKYLQYAYEMFIKPIMPKGVSIAGYIVAMMTCIFMVFVIKIVNKYFYYTIGMSKPKNSITFKK